MSAHSKQDALGDRKTSNKALVIAVVPGFVVHGAGHLYLGKTSTGLALLVTEVVGLGLFYVGAASTVGDGGSSVGVVLIPAGVVLFLGSWVVDIVGSANATQ